MLGQGVKNHNYAKSLHFEQSESCFWYFDTYFTKVALKIGSEENLNEEEDAYCNLRPQLIDIHVCYKIKQLCSW